MTTDNLPAAPDIERAVLGAMMIEPDCAGRVLGFSEFIFYNPQNLLMLRAIDDLYRRGEPIDQITVTERLKYRSELEKAGGEKRVAAICCETSTAANIDYYLKILRTKSALRKLINISTWIITECLKPNADPLEIVSSVAAHIQGIRDSLKDMDKTLVAQVR